MNNHSAIDNINRCDNQIKSKPFECTPSKLTQKSQLKQGHEAATQIGLHKTTA